MDTITPEQRRRCMRAVRSRDTLLEVIVRRWLYANGYRFRCQYRKVLGHPDIAIPKLKTLIEIRGCFWHRHEGCEIATTPKTNRAFWRAKFKANVEREWSALGWNLIIIWECALRTGKERVKTFKKVGACLDGFRKESV